MTQRGGCFDLELLFESNGEHLYWPRTFCPDGETVGECPELELPQGTNYRVVEDLRNVLGAGCSRIKIYKEADVTKFVTTEVAEPQTVELNDVVYNPLVDQWTATVIDRCAYVPFFGFPGWCDFNIEGAALALVSSTGEVSPLRSIDSPQLVQAVRIASDASAISWRAEAGEETYDLYATHLTPQSHDDGLPAMLLERGITASQRQATISGVNDTYLVAWVDERADADGDLFALRFDLSGVPLDDAPVSLSATPGSGVDLVRSTSDRDDRHVVVWREGSAGFRYAIMNSSGSLIDSGPLFNDTTLPSEVKQFHVDWLKQGRLVVVQQTSDTCVHRVFDLQGNIWSSQCEGDQLQLVALESEYQVLHLGMMVGSADPHLLARYDMNASQIADLGLDLASDWPRTFSHYAIARTYSSPGDYYYQHLTETHEDLGNGIRERTTNYRVQADWSADLRCESGYTSWGAPANTHDCVEISGFETGSAARLTPLASDGSTHAVARSNGSVMLIDGDQLSFATQTPESPTRASAVAIASARSGHFAIVSSVNQELGHADSYLYLRTLDLIPDDDGDGVVNTEDNCPNHANADQINSDGLEDGGDACDPNDDLDSIPDESDNCRTVSNEGQEDANGNGVGDACEFDHDDDGVLAELDPDDRNPNTGDASTPEICDGIDNNGNGVVDEGTSCNVCD
ncbi:MAG: thrombospondin type 3 repeat-containing protein [Myxococcota bacterium]